MAHMHPEYVLYSLFGRGPNEVRRVFETRHLTEVCWRSGFQGWTSRFSGKLLLGTNGVPQNHRGETSHGCFYNLGVLSVDVLIIY